MYKYKAGWTPDIGQEVVKRKFSTYALPETTLVAQSAPHCFTGFDFTLLSAEQ
jgi:hypothetical protein